MPTLAALRRYLAVDDPWERPGREISRRDVLVALGTAALSLATLELMRAVGTLDGVDAPRWVQWVVTGGPALLLLGRRRWPLTVLLVGSVVFWAIGTFASPMEGLASTQIVYFTMVFAGVAWARRRSEMVLVVGLVLALMAGWVVWGLAVGNALDAIISTDARTTGSVVAGVLLSTLVNVVFFGAAVVLGQGSWRSARQRAEVEQQARTITSQAGELRDRAVVAERLRIARELHDVVAHHVSVIGVQAAGARRAMDSRPETAKGALSVIEESSREAVTQMRSLVGTLRSVERPEEGPEDRGPQPGLDDIPALVAQRSGEELEVEHEVVTDDPDALDQAPAAVGHCLHRTVQEALTNVTRHSTARHARVVVRVRTRDGSPFAEVEVTDDGRARSGTSGSGLGHIGLRERAQSLGGAVEVGPRATGGYRVRLRVPLRTARS